MYGWKCSNIVQELGDWYRGVYMKTVKMEGGGEEGTNIQLDLDISDNTVCCILYEYLYHKVVDVH
jgi:hypothetical protein